MGVAEGYFLKGPIFISKNKPNRRGDSTPAGALKWDRRGVHVAGLCLRAWQLARGSTRGSEQLESPTRE